MQLQICHRRRNKLKSKEKLSQIQSNSIFMNRYELSPNLVLSQEQSRPDFFSTTNKLYSHDQENEDYKRGYTSDFYQSRRSEVVKNNQDLSIGSYHF